jgi:hypothetical protein
VAGPRDHTAETGRFAERGNCQRNGEGAGLRARRQNDRVKIGCKTIQRTMHSQQPSLPQSFAQVRPRTVQTATSASSAPSSRCGLMATTTSTYCSTIAEHVKLLLGQGPHKKSVATACGFWHSKSMTTIREFTKVTNPGALEIRHPALTPGQDVEVIVFVGIDQKETSPPTPPPMERRLKGDWGGALADLGERYTSVELQHKSLEWWGD